MIDTMSVKRQQTFVEQTEEIPRLVDICSLPRAVRPTTSYHSALLKAKFRWHKCSHTFISAPESSIALYWLLSEEESVRGGGTHGRISMDLHGDFERRCAWNKG